MDGIVYSKLRKIYGKEDSDGIVLRPIGDDDTDNIIRWRNSEAVRTHFIYRELLTVADHNHWLQNKVYQGNVIQYIIEYNKTPIGTVYIRDIDTKNESGEFGIYIGETVLRAKGLGTKTAKMLVSYCFELGFHRIFLRAFADNEIAINSYIKAGFTKEGTAKDMLLIDGKRYDVVFMSIINKDNC